MQITTVEQLEPGAMLGKSLFNNRGELLLAAGYEIDREMIGSLKRAQINYVFTVDELNAGIEPQETICEVIRQATTQKLVESFDNIRDNDPLKNLSVANLKDRLENDSKLKNLIVAPKMKQAVSDILEELFANHISKFTAFPAAAQSKADHDHAMDVSLLSLLIAQHFYYDKKELRSLGVAALVHDVGKLVAQGRLEAADFEELSERDQMVLREHPVISMLILKGSDPEAFSEQATVIQHHELANGTGYPQALRGCGQPPKKDRQRKQGIIFRHAEILAVANYYDNLISGAIDGIQYPSARAIARIIDEAGTLWNPYVARVLPKVIQSFPAGVTVKIANNSTGIFAGYRGIISKANEEDPTKPQIVLTHNPNGQPIKPEMIDFSFERYMELEVVL